MEPNAQLLLALLLVEHEDGNLDEDELLLFVHGIMPDFPSNLIQSIGNRLVFEGIDQETCIRRFRFTKPQVLELVHRLGLPDVMRSPSRHSWTGLEGLLVVLRRLSYPGRLGELCEEFGRSKSALSIVFNFTLLWIYNRWDGLLTDPFTHPFLTPAHLATYCQAVRNKSKVDLDVWGFIDGTVRSICRPSAHQRMFYNGHKRVHALKYQSVVTPDGLISHLYGPVEGRRHDAGVLLESNLLPMLQQYARKPNGDPCSLYGDPAYPMSIFILKGYQGAALTVEQQEFNSAMSSVRQAVEWGFGDVLSHFAFVDFKKQQKIMLQPVAAYYKVSCLFTNCRAICRGGNKTSKFFNMKPPTLAEYLA